jgi:hypothetical protein
MLSLPWLPVGCQKVEFLNARGAGSLVHSVATHCHGYRLSVVLVHAVRGFSVQLVPVATTLSGLSIQARFIAVNCDVVSPC